MDADAAGRRSATRPLRLVGHYDGTPPQLEALRVNDPARGRAPAGADTAILAYSGISVKMMVDRIFGADQVTMFTVDYELGGAAQAHDHPFEEAYVFLAGEVEARDRRPALHASDPATSPSPASGSVHGFYNDGHRTRPLDRDPGAPAAGAPRVPLGRCLDAAFEEG